MIEILSICLVVWIFYAWRTGKFKKEYQEKNNAEFKQTWSNLKQSFKVDNHDTIHSDIDIKESKEFLSKKQKDKLKKDQENYANELAIKHGTRSLSQDEKLKIEIKNEINSKLLEKSHNTDVVNLPNIQLYRYVLEYKDSNGNNTVRGIDITTVYKGYQNSRWYFKADTEHGERTFKSQRVIRLKDQYSNSIYNNAKEVREHLLSEYDVLEDNFFDD